MMMKTHKGIVSILASVIAVVESAKRGEADTTSDNMPEAVTKNLTNSTTHVASNKDMDKLPLSDVNFVVLSDLHAWFGGQRKHDQYLNADFGDVLSFYEQLKLHLEPKQDLFFVMNGDFCHGTILGVDPPRPLEGIMQHMPFDLVTFGDQEVESNVTIQLLREPGSLIDWWGPKLVTSNMFVKNQTGSDVPLGYLYRYLHGTSATILCFAFLDSLLMDSDETTSSVQIKPVEDMLEMPWFQEVLKGKGFEIVLVLAHMDLEAPLVAKILHKIRSVCGSDMVVEFLTGHTLRRGFAMLDNKAAAFQAGGKLDTIGFLSFDLDKSLFKHVFVNANTDSFANALGMSGYTSPAGMELRDFITRTEKDAGGNEILGCSPGHFRADGLLESTNSLLQLYLEYVLPKGLLQDLGSSTKTVGILLQRIEDFLHNDLFPGVITMNDLVTIVPRDDTIRMVAKSFRGDQIDHLRETLSDGKTFLNGTEPIYGYTMYHSIMPHGTYNLFTLDNDASRVHKAISAMKARYPADEPVHDGKTTIRGVWVDFFRTEWPYDDDSCKTSSKAWEGKGDQANTEDEKSDEAYTEAQGEDAADDDTLKAQKWDDKREENDGIELDERPVPGKSEAEPSSSGSGIGMIIVIASLFFVVRTMFQRAGGNPFGQREGVELRNMDSTSYRDQRPYQDQVVSYQSSPTNAFQAQGAKLV